MPKDMTSKHSALLPSGFEDLLPPQAEGEYRAMNVMMDVFSGFGYARVKPPLLEFEDTLMAPGPGAALSSETFRVMDPVTHRMMGVRADVTAQIARLAHSRLSEKNRPLRLTYANDVIRTRASQQRTQRQFTQVGCEIVGADDAQADIEICVVALKALKEAGIENVTIDLTVPGLTGALLESLDADLAEDVRKILAGRDEDKAEELKDKKLSKALIGLMRASGRADKALKALRDVKLPIKDDAKVIKRLGDIVGGIQAAIDEFGLDNVSVTIDPVEMRGFEYHNSVAFTLFSSGVRGELGRGGRYDIVSDGASETATGFTLYMDTLRQGLRGDAAVKHIFAAAGTAWSDIQDLQADGWSVHRQMGKQSAPAFCTHIFKNGSIQEV